MATRKHTEPGNQGSRALRSWRKRSRLTLRSAGVVVGLWPNSLLELEHGRRIPSLQIAVKLEQLAGIECKRWLQA